MLIQTLVLHPAVESAVRALQASKLNRGEYVFTSPHGTIYQPGPVINRVFKPLAKKLETPAFTWRSFRRSVETLMHNHGVPLKVQQQILGHANPNMTLPYAEANEPGQRRAIEELGKLTVPNLLKLAQISDLAGSNRPN